MRVVWPLPPRREANAISATFLDPYYPRWRQQRGLSADEHPGIDVNLVGTSGDQDFRYPVVSCSDGVVTHAQMHRVWGNVVVIHMPDWLSPLRRDLYWRYAHLHDVLVRVGDVVRAGDVIGTIGRGDPARPFVAHLHLDIATALLPGDYWPRTRENVLRYYIDPLEVLRRWEDYTRRYFFQKVVLLDGEPPTANLQSLTTLWVRRPQ